MQPNAITVQETSASVAGHEFADDAARSLGASCPARHTPASVGESAAAQNTRCTSLAARRLAPVSGYPYARIHRAQAFYDVCKRGRDVAFAFALLVLTLPASLRPRC